MFNALECTENDYEALFALCLLYAMGHNDGRSPYPITLLLTLSYIYHTLEPFLSGAYTCPDKWNILDYKPLLYTALIWSAIQFSLQPCWRVFVLL